MKSYPSTDPAPVSPAGTGSSMVGRPELLARFERLSGVDWEALEGRFPISVPRAFLDAAEGPGREAVLRQALPDPRELVSDAGDVPDPVGEQRLSPLPWVVRKHKDRVLLLLTKRCHLYCRYCFRADHQPGADVDPTEQEWAAMLEYARQSGADEVILSGGDPLAIRDQRLFDAIDAVRTHVPVIRIHTRAPITFPTRVTEALITGLKARNPVWVIVHCNHAAELTPAVRAALSRFVDAGIPVLNQSVLLRGVNDDAEVLSALCTELVRLRVFPYYLHHPDAVPGNAHFRLTQEEGRAIYAALSTKVSGLALPRYVYDPPDGSGKRDV